MGQMENNPVIHGTKRALMNGVAFDLSPAG